MSGPLRDPASIPGSAVAGAPRAPRLAWSDTRSRTRSDAAAGPDVAGIALADALPLAHIARGDAGMTAHRAGAPWQRAFAD